MKTHIFLSTGAAYDACQCDDDINDGDILLIPSEQVVGVADTWPFAVTKKSGDLHGVSDWTHPHLDQYASAIAAARELATEHGWELAS